LVILPVTVTFLLRGRHFLALWMGPEYAGLSGDVLHILAIALTFTAGPHVAVSALMGLNRHREVVPFSVTEAVVNIGLSVYWIGTLGLVGMALGTAIPRLTMCLVVTPWLLRRHVAAPLVATWRELWARPLAAAVPFAAASWLVERYWPAENLAVYFAQVAAALPAMAAGIWLAGVTRRERSALFSLIIHRIRAARARVP
jgi:Na+-driven multidrug efflux pump